MRYRQIFTQVATVEWAIAGAVAFVLLSLLAFVVVRYRAGRQVSPSRNANATRLELGYLGVLVLFGIGLYVWQIGRNGAERHWQGAPAVTVDVIGFRWCWRFHYPGAGVVSTGTCAGAVPRRPTLPAAHTLPVLEVPAHELVRFNVTSVDVIHGFWIPTIDFKMYAYPEHVNAFEARFDHLGTSTGRCAVYCGLDHFQMDYLLRVVSPGVYHHWLAAHRGVTFAGAHPLDVASARRAAA